MQFKTADNLGLNDSGRAQQALGIVLGDKRPDLLREELLSELFSVALHRWPQRTAIVCGEKSWSFRALDDEATAIARGLVRAGIGPNHVVGLWMPRGPQALIAQIAITKAGAAWLPFDAEAPADRIATCLEDAEAKLVLTAPCYVSRLTDLNCPVKTPADLVDAGDHTIINPRLRGLTPDHPAYLIYTSGSTGKPKGIAISHRNICHYLRAANSIFDIRSDDVVFQGASIAFDLSMEEIWIPYMAGACLWVATADVLGQADRLAEVMTAARISVLDTVPTLLSMLSGDVPTLRTIILGGEACPPNVLERWSRPGRRIFNSYGPTEATVVATIAELRAGEPVTIGRPIPNYTCYIVDAAMQPVPAGVEGELLLGGPGIAKGYLGRPDLTRQKFISNPFPFASGDPILYRSGDAAVFDSEGQIDFRGRIDDQVKIRGFRVELGEIEVAIADLPEVAQAATVLRKDGDIDQLVAFVRKHPGSVFDAAAARAVLRVRLPAYMVPQHFELIEGLPTLSSGKLDRKALQALPLTFKADAEAQEDPKSATEAALLTAAQVVFPGRAIPFESDFFTDIGGHSLLAARFISLVRETSSLAGITLKDMYAQRTLRAIAREVDARTVKAAAAPAAAIDNTFVPVPLLRRFLCGMAQAAVLPIVLALSTGQWLAVYISYTYVTPADATFLVDAAYVIAIAAVFQLFNLFLAIAVKWLVLGRTKPGRYPMWGSYYFRVWMVRHFAALAHENWLQGTPFYRYYLRLMGAKVGHDTIIGSQVKFEAYDLVSIGAHVTVGSNTTFAITRVIGNEFVVGAIAIGEGVTVGGSCVIEAGSTVGDYAELNDLTSVLAGSHIKAFEIWEGSPARKTGTIDPGTLTPPASASTGRRVLQHAAYLLALILLPPLALVPLIPAFYLIEKLSGLIAPFVSVNYLYYVPLLAWPAAMLEIAVTAAFITAMRWIILPRVQPGTYSVHSWFYLRKWSLWLAVEVVLEVLGAMYATVYMRGWYRAMGMKIGRDSEVSSSFAGLYDLVEIGDKCFLGDRAVLGEEEIRHGWMTLGRVKVGDKVFVGNAAIVPPGSTLGDGSLIGVYTRAPGGDQVKANDTWYGSPAIRLPVRQNFKTDNQLWTFEPTRWMRTRRAIFEAFNSSFPTMVLISLGTLSMELIQPYIDDIDQQFGLVVLLVVILSACIGVVSMLFAAAQKWLLMGTYKPTQQPMWSWWAMRTEAVAVCYDSLCSQGLFQHLCGTPMLPWCLRLFGVKIGRGVYLDCTDITEFDCVTIGDHAAINDHAMLQTHLYEDRQMKVGRIKIGNGVTIGPAALVLYDTDIGDNARLSGLTTIMKGECLPPNTNWAGSPAEAQ